MNVLLYTAVSLSVLLIFNLNYASCRYTENPESTETLVFTSILYRHGDRSPDGFYPTDPYKDLSYWPDGLGMLTKAGKMRHFRLGQWLRKRYECLIPDGKYHHNLIHVQSTNVDRTLMSAQANLAGMFYPTQQERWSDLDWQPVPVHTIPKKLDKLLAVEYPCPKIQEEDKEVSHLPILELYYEKYKDFYDYISSYVDFPGTNVLKSCTVYMNMEIESVSVVNFTLPAWAEKIYPEKLGEVNKICFVLPTMTKTLKRLRGGPLLKDIVTHMKKKRDGTLSPDRNIWVYSAHDKTIAALLDTMGVFEPHIPPFAATVMVELRKDAKNDFYVSVHYKNTTEEPTLLTIPGCTPSCPLDMFESLLSDVIPEDWDKECGLTNTFMEQIDIQDDSSV